MSQEKVDRYKQEKANRKKIMRKQKVMNIVRKSVLHAGSAGPCGMAWVFGI